MATAKKLPSGQWRTLVYSHTDAAGKRHYESFTADTKKESEFLAAEFTLRKKGMGHKQETTLEDSMHEYIQSRTNVLSPSTIREYMRMVEKNFEDLKGIKPSKLTSQMLQKWINDFSADHSPKTVKNNYGFLNAVLIFCMPDRTFHVRLPQNIQYTASVPSDEDVAALIQYYREYDKDMYIASCLAAFGSLRRSEICPLDADDIQGNCVMVRKAMVLDHNAEWITKYSNKTSSSNRIVPMPDSFICDLPQSGPLITINPDQITRRHERALKKLNIPSFRFHDLRHYTASIMHAIKIPDQYIMARGGWSSDRTLKAVYRGTIDDYTNEYTNQALEHFEQVFSQAFSEDSNHLSS